MDNNTSFFIDDSGAAAPGFETTLGMTGVALWKMEFDDERDFWSGRLRAGGGFADFLGIDPNDDALPTDFTGFISRFFHPGDVVDLRDGILDCLAGKTDRFAVRHRLWHARQKRWRRVDAVGTRCEGADGARFIAGALREAGDAGQEAAAARTDAVPREEEARIRAVLDAMPFACHFWNEDIEVVDVNRAALDMFSLPDRWTYQRLFKALSPALQPDGIPSARTMPARVRDSFVNGGSRFEWTHQRLDGELIPCEVTLVRVAFGEKYIVASYMRDLRDLKLKERELENERRLLRRIVNHSPVCFLIGVADRVRFITPHARAILDVDLGSAVKRLYADPDAAADIARDIRKDGVVSWRSVAVRGRDGRVFEMLLNAFAADYFGDAGVMYWLMDVTEMKEKERQLQAARDQAEESAKAKGAFLANMSHEIRTPMNAIIGLTQLMQQTELSERQQEYVNRTDTAAKTLLRIINDILDFSKIDAGRLDMEKIEFHLDDVLRGTVALLAERAEAKKLELVLDLPPETPFRLVGDPSRLSQIVVNLLSNAVKFTDEGEIVLSVQTEWKTEDETFLRFEVRDSGIGLTGEQRGRLFRAFTQADSSTTRKYGGTGLGLVISKSLVEMMGGTIGCESEYGKGSVFSFTARFGLYNRRPGTVHLDVEPDTFSGMRALAVDDNASALEVLKLNLEGMGFSVVTADSGTEALNLVSAMGAKAHLDLIVIDWKMPDLDGIETVRRLGEMLKPNRLPPVVMATDHDGGDPREKAREAGIGRVVAKPLSSSTLFNLLSAVFRHSGRRKRDVRRRLDASMVRHLAGARILLAEDNDVNQLVASRLLGNAGFDVTVVANGKEAVDAVAADYFDLVLMDIQMPEMDGLEATRRIRAMPAAADIPIVAMTAHALTGDRDVSIEAGMDDHVTKPIDIGALFEAIARLVPHPGHRRGK